MITKEPAYMEQVDTRIGRVIVHSEDIIHFPQGILPFTAAHRFVLIAKSDEAPFAWLVALDERELAFVVVRPEDVLAPLELSAEQLAEVELTEVDAALVLTIVVIGDDPAETTMNLLAPLIVNPQLQIGKQIIQQGDMELARYPLGQQITDLGQESVDEAEQRTAA